MDNNPINLTDVLGLDPKGDGKKDKNKSWKNSKGENIKEISEDEFDVNNKNHFAIDFSYGTRYYEKSCSEISNSNKKTTLDKKKEVAFNQKYENYQLQKKQNIDDINVKARQKQMQLMAEQIKNSGNKTSSDNSNFPTAIKLVLENEGGWKNEPLKDKGDPTNMGISWPIFKKYAMTDLGIEATVENLHKLTVHQATIIYKKRYWEPRGFGKINDIGLAIAIYDWTITSGGAIKEIQKLLNSEFGTSLKVDGAIGPNTINAINSVTNKDQLFNRINEIRKEYYQKGADAGWFSKDYLNGLNNRVDKLGKR